MNEDYKKLYEAVSARFDIGDYESFQSKMQTPEDRKRFYNVVSERGFDLGDYESYENRLSVGGGSVGKPQETSGQDSQTPAQPSTESGEGIDFNAVKYGVKPPAKQKEETTSIQGAVASFKPPSPLELRRGESEEEYQIRKNQDLILSQKKQIDEQLNSISIGFDEANKNIETLNSLTEELNSIKPPQGVPTPSEIKNITDEITNLSSELENKNKYIEKTYSSLFSELDKIPKNDKGEYIIDDEKTSKRIQSQLEEYNKDIKPLQENQSRLNELIGAQNKAVNIYNNWLSENYPSDKVAEAERLFKDYEAFKSVENEGKKRYEQLAEEKANLISSEVTLQSRKDAINDKKIQDFRKDLVQNLPISQQAGMYLFGGLKMGLESISGSLATSQSRQSEQILAPEDQTQAINFNAVKYGIKPTKEQDLAFRKNVYEWGQKMYEKSKKTEVDYGLVNSLKNVDNPLDVLSFALTSIAEQAPQIPLAITTFGGSTYFQELGGMQQEIVQYLMDERGMTLEEALDSEEANKMATNLTALGIASLDMLGLVGQFGGKVLLGNTIKSGIKQSAVDRIVLGTTSELATETGQEFLAKGGVSQAKGGGFIEGMKEMTSDEIKDLWAKVLFSSGTFTSVNTLIEGKVNKDNIETLNEASTNPEVLNNLTNHIQSLSAANVISTEEADRQIAELNASVAANLQIPENIKGEQRSRIVELQKEYNALAEEQKRVPPAFKPMYKEKMDAIQEKIAEIAQEPQVSEQVDETVVAEDEIAALEKEIAEQEKSQAKPLQKKQKGQDITLQEENVLVTPLALDYLDQEVIDENGNVGTIKQEGEGGRLVFESGNRVLELGSADNVTEVTLREFGLSPKPDSDFTQAEQVQKTKARGEQRVVPETKDEGAAGVTEAIIQEEDFKQKSEEELAQMEKQAEEDVRVFEEMALGEAAKKSKNRDIVQVGENIFQVTQKPDGTFSVSQMREDGKLVGIKDPKKVRQAIGAFKSKKSNTERRALAEAEKQIAEFRKQEEDKILNWLDQAINATSNKGRAYDATLGIPMFVANSSLKILRAAYKAGKTLAEAINDAIEHIKKQGYTPNELEYKKFVLNELKKQSNAKKQQGSPQKGKSTSNKNMPKGNGTVVQDGKKEQISKEIDKQKKAAQSKKEKYTPKKTKGLISAVESFIKGKIYSYEKTGEKDSQGKEKRRRVVKPYSALQFKEDMKEFGFSDDFLSDVYIKANPEIKNLNGKRLNAAKNIDKNKLGNRVGNALKNITKIPPQFIPIEMLDKYIEALNWLGQRTSNFKGDEYNAIKQTLNEVKIEADYQMGMYNEYIEKLKNSKTPEEYTAAVNELLENAEINKNQAEFLNKKKPKVPPTKKERIEFDELNKKPNINTVNLSEKERKKVRVVEGVTKEDYELLSDDEVVLLDNVLQALNEDYVPTSVYDMASRILANRNANNMQQSIKGMPNLINKIRNLFSSKISETTERRFKKAGEETVDSTIGLKGTAIRDTMRPTSIAYGEYKETVDKIRGEMSKMMESFGSAKKAMLADIKVAMFRYQRQKDSNKQADEVDSVKDFISRLNEDEKTKRIFKDTYGEEYFDAVNEIYNQFKDGDGNLNRVELYKSMSPKEKKLLNISDKLVKKAEQYAIDAAAERGMAIELVDNYAHIPAILGAMPKTMLDSVADTVNSLINGMAFRFSTKAGTLEKRKKVTPVVSFSNFDSVVKGLDKTYKDYYLTDVLKTEARSFRKLDENLVNDKEAEPIAAAIVKGVRDTRNALFMANYLKESENPFISFIANNTATALLGTTQKLVQESITNPAYQLLRYAMKGQISKIPKLIYYMAGETVPSLRKSARLSEKLMNDVIISLAPAQQNRYLQGQKFSGEQLTIEKDYEGFSPYEKTKGEKVVRGLSKFRRKTGLKRLGEYLASGNDQVMSRSIFRIEFEDAFKKLTGKSLTKEDYRKIANKDASFYDKYSEQLEKATSMADEEVATGFTTTNEMQRSYNQLVASQKGGLAKMKYFMLPFQIGEYQTMRKAIINDGLKALPTTVLPIMARQILYNYLAQIIPSLTVTAIGALAGDEEDKEELTKMGTYLDDEIFIQSLISASIGMFVFRDMSNYVRLPAAALIEVGNMYFGDKIGIRDEDKEYNKYRDGVMFTQFDLNPNKYSPALSSSIGVTKAFLPQYSPMLDVVEPTVKSEKVQEVWYSIFDEDGEVKEDRFDDMDYYGNKALLKLGVANGLLPADAYRAYTYYFNKDIIQAAQKERNSK